MNGDDPFEAKLKRQTPRHLPGSWRGEILQAAQVPEATRPSLWALLFWPHPRAWAALGAVWLVALGLNFSARETSASAVADHAIIPSSLAREGLRQQEQMFAELAGAEDKPLVSLPAPLPPQPRSQRREESRNV